jgi:peptidoglycan/LPS O-acetylase OafA/YrhL
VNAPRPADPSGRRTDIEGLRAVAILLVLAAHAGFAGLAGGFVGVDVFFVISGFLITGILARLARDRPPGGLADFYARRLRRLLPALLLVQLATMLVAGVLLDPRTQLQQADGAMAASLWVSNFLFALGNTDYFGPSAGEALFLHTWSLGVEEQFYLLWPALVLVAFAVFRGGVRDGGLRRATWLLGALALLGFVASAWITAVAPLQAYYLLPARMWQFALGGALALWTMHRGARPLPTRASAALGTVGLAAIAGAALWLDGSQPYPGGWALAPTLGTAAVIAAGQGSRFTGWLAWPPMQWLGRHSYGWYLWHWPVLLLGRAMYPAGGVGLAILLALLALVLAVASRRFVEEPVRLSPVLAARPRLSIALGLGAMLACLGGAMAWEAQAMRWAAQPRQSDHYVLANADYEVYARSCDEWFHSDRVNPCTWGAPDAPRTLVVLGDSIGLQWFPALMAAFPAPEWQVVVLTKSACPMVDATYFYPHIGRDYTECDTWRAGAVATIAGNRPDVVVIGSAPSPQFDDDALRAGARRIMADLGAGATTVFVLAPTPTLPFDGPRCLARADWRPRWMGAWTSDCHAPLADADHPRDARLLAEAAAPLANVHVLAFDDVVCPGQRCGATVDGRVAYRDAQHLAGPFVASLAPVMTARMAAAVDNRGPEASPAFPAGPRK